MQVRLATRLAANHPDNMRLMKGVINRELRRVLDAALEAESQAIQESMMLAMPVLMAKRRKEMKEKKEKKRRAKEAGAEQGGGSSGRAKL
mgnify:CR=1 FL=1